jgi:hypothetical protein
MKYEEWLEWGKQQGLPVEEYVSKGVEPAKIQQGLEKVYNELQLAQAQQTVIDNVKSQNHQWAQEQGINLSEYPEKSPEEMDKFLADYRAEVGKAPLTKAEKEELALSSQRLLIEGRIDVSEWTKEGLNEREVYERTKKYEMKAQPVERIGTRTIPPAYYGLHSRMEDELKARGQTIDNAVDWKQRYFIASKWFLDNDAEAYEKIVNEELKGLGIVQGVTDIEQQNAILNHIPSEIKPYVLTSLLKVQEWKALNEANERARKEIIRPTSTWEMVTAMPGRMYMNMPENIIKSTEGIISLAGMVGSRAIKLGRGLYQDIAESQPGSQYQEAATDVVESITGIASTVYDSVMTDMKSIWQGDATMAQTAIGRTLAKDVHSLRERPTQTVVKYASENPLDFILLANAARATVEKGAVKILPHAQKLVSMAEATSAKYVATLAANNTIIGGGLREAAHVGQAIVHGTNRIMDVMTSPRKPYSLHMKSLAVNSQQQTVAGVSRQIDMPARQYPDDPFFNLFIKGSFDSTIRKVPGFEKVIAENKALGWVEDLRNQWDDWAYSTRTYFIDQFDDLYRKVPASERTLISPFLEGKILQETGRVHPNYSDEFYDYINYYHQVDDMIATQKFKLGFLDKPTMDNILYEPIQSITGETVDEIKNRLGDLSKLGMAYVKRIDSRKELAPGSFIETTLDAMTDTKGKRKMTMGQFFQQDTKTTQGFQKIRGRLTPEEIANGAIQNYSIDMKDIVPRWIADYTRITATEKTLDGIAARFGTKINLKDIDVIDEIKGIFRVKGTEGDEIFEGMTIFSPNGLKQFYKSKIDIYKRAIDSLDSSMSSDEVLAKYYLEKTAQIKELQVTTMGATSNVEAYLVPQKLANHLKSLILPVPDEIRLFYDAPLGVWKRMTLATPQWIVNNAFGDIFFAAMSGTKPGSMTDFFKDHYKAVIPMELQQANSLNVLARSEELGRAAYTTTGRMLKAIKENKIFQKIDEFTTIPFAINNHIEAPFSGGFYIQLAKKEAAKLLPDTATEKETYGMLYKIAHDDKYSGVKQKILNEVRENYPIFNKTGKWERLVARRIMPFYNWMKFMTIYGTKLPLNHPFKVATLNTLGNFAEDERERLYKEHFPYMEAYINENGIPHRYSGLYPLWKDRDGSVVMWNAKSTIPLTTIRDVLFTDHISAISPLIRIPIEIMGKENLFTGKEFEMLPSKVSEEHDFEALAIPETVLRQSPQYRFAREMIQPAKTYTQTGLLSTPKIKQDVIRDINTGEIKYPLSRLETMLRYHGISLKHLSDDSNFNLLDQDLTEKIEKFKTQQWSKETNVTIDDMIYILQTALWDIYNNQSEEYDSIRKSIKALQLVKREEKIANKIRERVK